MTLGEIKIEALKLMFANGHDDISEHELETLKNDNQYKDYLINMPGAINRCFSVLEERRVLPVRVAVVKRESGSGDGHMRYFDLASIIPDFFDIERISYISKNGEYTDVDEYEREGDVIIVPDIPLDTRVIYKPSLERILATTDEKTVLSIPDRIACHIPYFIKGELFRVDEPDEAGEARNWFETAIAQITKAESGKQSRVVHSYSACEV